MLNYSPKIGYYNKRLLLTRTKSHRLKKKTKIKTDDEEIEIEGKSRSQAQTTKRIWNIDNVKQIATNRTGIGFLFKCNKSWPFAIKYSLCSMKFLIKCNRICNFKLEIESIERLFSVYPFFAQHIFPLSIFLVPFFCSVCT